MFQVQSTLHLYLHNISFHAEFSLKTQLETWLTLWRPLQGPCGMTTWSKSIKGDLNKYLIITNNQNNMSAGLNLKRWSPEASYVKGVHLRPWDKFKSYSFVSADSETLHELLMFMACIKSILQIAVQSQITWVGFGWFDQWFSVAELVWCLQSVPYPSIG